MVEALVGAFVVGLGAYINDIPQKGWTATAGSAVAVALGELVRRFHAWWSQRQDVEGPPDSRPSDSSPSDSSPSDSSPSDSRPSAQTVIPPAPHFTGRTAELTELRDALDRRLAPAGEYLAEALTILDGGDPAQRDPTQRAIALRSLGQVRRRQLRFRDAARCFEQALGVLEGLDNPIWHARVRGVLGRVRLDQHRLSEARTLQNQAFEVFQQFGYPLWTARTLRNLAQVDLREENTDKAEARILESIRLFAEQGAELWQAHARFTLGQVRREQRRLPEAAEEFAAVGAVFDRFSDRWTLAEALLALGEVHRRLDRTDEARIDLERAVRIFEDPDFQDIFAAGDALLVLGTLSSSARLSGYSGFVVPNSWI